MGPVSRDLRLKLFGKFESGLSITEIVKETGMSKSTVWRWKKRFDEGSTVDHKKRSGRPRKTNKKQDHRLFHLA